MAVFKKQSRAESEIPTASMADIAFLLLIFFLVTTIFQDEKGLTLVLPESQSQVEVSQSNIMHIIVRQDGLVDVKRGESPQVQTVPASRMEGIWRQAFAENDKLIAAVKTHPDAAYEHMVAVLDELLQGGASRVNLQQLEQ